MPGYLNVLLRLFHWMFKRLRRQVRLFTCIAGLSLLWHDSANALTISPADSQDGVIHAAWASPSDYSFISEFTSSTLTVQQDGTNLFVTSLPGMTTRQLLSDINSGSYLLLLEVCGQTSSGANQCYQETQNFSVTLDASIGAFSGIVATADVSVSGPVVAAEVISANRIRLSWDIGQVFAGENRADYTSISGIPPESGVNLPTCTWLGSEYPYSDYFPPQTDICASGSVEFNDPNWEQASYQIAACNYMPSCGHQGCPTGTWDIGKSCGPATRISASDGTGILNLPPLVAFERSHYESSVGQTVSINVKATDLELFSVPNISETITKVELYVTNTANQLVGAVAATLTDTTASNDIYNFNVPISAEQDYYLVAMAYDSLGETAYATSYIRVIPANTTSPPVSSVNTIPVNFDHYQIQFGDIDGDGYRDLYFHGLTRFVLIHGDVIIPIALPTPTGFVFYGDEAGVFGEAEPMDFTHEALEEKIAQGELVVVTSGQRVQGDINGDGYADILVKSPDGSGSSLIIEGLEGATLPQILVEILASGHTKTPGQSLGQAPSFSNNLFDQTVALSPSGLTLNARTLTLNELQQGTTSEGTAQAQNHNIATPPIPAMPKPSLTASQIAEMDNLIGVNGSFQVNEMGAATYVIPVRLPAGTAGVAPPVTLNYSNQNQDGIMGLGWQLNAGGSISRCRQTLQTDGVTMPINFAATDRFCLNGQRLLLVYGTQYGATGTRYKTEVDSGNLVFIESAGSGHIQFVVYGKDGSKSVYGGTENSRRFGYTQSGGEAKDKVISWNLSRFEDSVGNQIRYDYGGTEDYYRLQQIDYGFGASGTPSVQVLFEYQPKNKTFENWVAGYNFKDNSLLNGIRVVDNNQLLHNYTFSYNDGLSALDGDYFDRLTSVEFCRDARCSLPLSFQWGSASAQSELAGIVKPNTSASRVLPSRAPRINRINLDSDYSYLNHTPLDFNGDAIPDLAILYTDWNRQYYISYQEQQLDGTYINAGGHRLDWQSPINIKKLSKLLPVDLNADGRSDLAIYDPKNQKWLVALSAPMPNNRWQLGDPFDQNNPSETFLPAGLPEHIRFADLNSDGLADLFYVKNNQFRAHYLRRVAIDDGSAQAYRYAEVAEISEDVNGLSLKYFGGFTDLNQDGKVDIVALSTRVNPQIFNLVLGAENGKTWECHYDVEITTLLSAADSTFTLSSEALISNGVIARSIPPSEFSPPIDASCDFDLEEYVGVTPPTLTDINSDGLTDMLLAYSQNHKLASGRKVYKYDTIRYRLGQPNLSFGVEQSYTVPAEAQPLWGFQLLDGNYDNAMDLVFELDNNAKKYVSWVDGSFTDTTEDLVYRDPNGVTQLGDFNGDGVLDLSLVKDNKIALALGVNAPNNLITTFINPLGGSTRVQYEPLNRSGSYQKLDGISTESKYTGDECTQWLDRDTGNTYSVHPPISGTFECLQWEPYYRTYAEPSDFYREINNPFGMEDPSSSLYTRLDGETVDVSKNGPAQEFLTAMPVVTAIGFSAPTAEDHNALAVVEYQYEGLKIQAGGRGVLGFRARTTTDRQTGVSTETRYRQDWPFMGSPKQTTVKTSTGQVLSESFTSMRLWGIDESNMLSVKQQIAAGGTNSQGPLVIYAATTVDRTYDVDAAHLQMPSALQGSPTPSDNWLKQVSISNQVDSWNNNIASTVTTYASSSNGEPLLVESKVTSNTYFDDDYSDDFPVALTNEKRLGRLQKSVVTTHRPGAEGSDKTITRTANFTYYGYSVTNASCSGNPALKGLLCSEEVLVSDTESSAAPALTKHFYDAFGNKTHNQTGTRVSPYNQYDSDGRYVQSNFDVFSAASQESGQSPGGYSVPAGAVAIKTREVLQRSIQGTPLLVRNYIGAGQYTYAMAAVTPLGVPYFNGDSSGAWQQNRSARLGSVGIGAAACPPNTATVSITESAGGASSGSCFDKVGQSIGAYTTAFDGRVIRSEIRRDTLGRTLAVSEPSYAATPELFTYSTFDILGRPTHIVHPILITDDQGNETGSNVRTTNVYQGLSTTTISSGITGGEDREKTEVKDVLGQLVQVTEQGARTANYFYDVQGNLARMIDPMNNPSMLYYNGLGQKIAMDDPDNGVWSYEYNEYGELVKQTDANYQTTVIEYDFKGRKRLSKTFSAENTDPEQPDLLQQWDYDLAANGLGQVAREQDYSTQGDGSQAWTTRQYLFDSLGRAEQTITTLQGPSGQERFYQKQNYDQYGRIHQSFDAARIGPQYQYNGTQNVYNPFGYLSEVVDAANDASAGLVYRVKAMDARGNVTQMLYGDGNSVRYYYNQRTGLLESIWRNGVLATTDQEYTARWDHLGNLVSRADDLLGGTPETFKYDQYNRLISNTFGGAQDPTVAISYDLIDNITSKSDQQNSAPYEYTHPTKKHAVVKVGTRNLTYDGNGNVTHDGNKVIAYSVKDQALKITTPTHRTEFSYALGARYKRVDIGSDGTTTTLYVGSVEKVYNADGSIIWKRNIAGKAQIIHTQTSSGLGAGTRNYFFHDHLGSVVAISNSIGQIVQRLAYDPWGKRRKISNNQWQPQAMEQSSILQQYAKTAKPITNQGFTGHEMLDEVGIIHMNGRIYDASLGRFLQADPFIQAPTAIGSLNRYSYLMNNPLNGTDPTGYIFKKMLRAIGGNQWLSMMISIGLNFVPGCLSWCSAVFNAATTYAVTGSLKAAAIGFAASMISPAGFSPGEFITRGIIGGITSTAMGGEFGHGFIAAAASGGRFGNNPATRVITAAVIGGTVSRITGGKFANGAVGAAFAAVVGELGRSEIENRTTTQDLTADEIHVKRTPVHSEKVALLKGAQVLPQEDGTYIIVAHGNKDSMEMDIGDASVMASPSEWAKRLRNNLTADHDTVKLYSCYTGSDVKNGFAARLHTELKSLGINVMVVAPKTLVRFNTKEIRTPVYGKVKSLGPKYWETSGFEVDVSYHTQINGKDIEVSDPWVKFD